MKRKDDFHCCLHRSTAPIAALESRRGDRGGCCTACGRNGVKERTALAAKADAGAKPGRAKVRARRLKGVGILYRNGKLERCSKRLASSLNTSRRLVRCPFGHWRSARPGKARYRAAMAVALTRKAVTGPLFRFAKRVLDTAQLGADLERTAIMSDANTKPRANLYQRITDQIIAELERGALPWRKPWDTGLLGDRVTRPLRHSGEPYRGINIVALWMAATASGFASPFWMTYRQALEFDGQVRKGEKGQLVVFASSMTKVDEAAPEGADPREVHFMKGFTVFNVAQIDGLPARFSEPAPAPRLDVPTRDAKAEAFFNATAAVILHGGTQAYYAPEPDCIRLPPFESFRDTASYYATRAHETVHWTAHKTRLDRSFDHKRFGDEGYAMEELVAELGAAFLCADFALTPELRPDHASYIENWLLALKNDNRAIFTAAAHAQRACDFLHGFKGKTAV
jgi:antirestriction protein ArdC